MKHLPFCKKFTLILTIILSMYAANINATFLETFGIAPSETIDECFPFLVFPTTLDLIEDYNQALMMLDSPFVTLNDTTALEQIASDLIDRLNAFFTNFPGLSTSLIGNPTFKFLLLPQAITQFRNQSFPDDTNSPFNMPLIEKAKIFQRLQEIHLFFTLADNIGG